MIFSKILISHYSANTRGQRLCHKLGNAFYAKDILDSEPKEFLKVLEEQIDPNRVFFSKTME